MRTKTPGPKAPAERVLKDIRRATRKHYSTEDKIRIVLEGLRGEDSIAELCRREGIAQSMYYGWSKEFLEAGKRRLAGDTARAAIRSMSSTNRDCCPTTAPATSRKNWPNGWMSSIWATSVGRALIPDNYPVRT